MPTQPDPSRADLDRTDELPVLDVAAYEASLAESEKGLSRTDVWAVEALHDMDEISEAAQKSTHTAVRRPGKESASAEALTLNVERILKRIAELEADITAAHEANAALQKRSKSIETERDQHLVRIRSLEADHARLTEHRMLSDGVVEKLERQMREQSQKSEAELRNVQSLRSAEATRAEQERQNLKRQLEEAQARTAELEDGSRALQSRLTESNSVAEQRAQSLASLGKSLGDEKAANTTLSRQLAAKLKEHERLNAIIEQRERTIDELTQARDELNARIEHQSASTAELAARANALEQELKDGRTVLQGKEALVAEKDHELIRLRAALEAAEQRESNVKRELSAAVLAVDEAEPRRVELEARLQEGEQEMSALTAERDAAYAQVRTISDARDELTEGLRAQLQTARDEQAIMAGQLSKLRARVKSLTQQIFSRDNEIATLRQDLAVHTEALDAIRRDVNRIGGHVDDGDEQALPDVEHTLEPVDHSGETILLNRRSFTIGRTSENDICLPSHLISRHHARLLVGPTGVIIEDAGSTNGCFVNGEQVRQHLMRDGDVLELGDLRYRLCTQSPNDTKVRTSRPTLTAIGSSKERSIALVPAIADKNNVSGVRTELN